LAVDCYFPLVTWSDGARVIKARGGRSIHPIRAVPAILPRSERAKFGNRLTFGYISDNADESEALNVFRMCVEAAFACVERRNVIN
jgi:hypothetical protein